MSRSSTLLLASVATWLTTTVALPTTTLSTRAEPASNLKQTFTLGFFLPYCDTEKSIVTLASFDEFDAPAFPGDVMITTTGLRDFQHAGKQIKGVKGSCQFGEIRFTRIPFEPRRFTITVTDDGHRQKKQECSLTFDEDPDTERMDYLVDYLYVDYGTETRTGEWNMVCKGENFHDEWRDKGFDRRD